VRGGVSKHHAMFSDARMKTPDLCDLNFVHLISQALPSLLEYFWMMKQCSLRLRGMLKRSSSAMAQGRARLQCEEIETPLCHQLRSPEPGRFHGCSRARSKIQPEHCLGTTVHLMALRNPANGITTEARFPSRKAQRFFRRFRLSAMKENRSSQHFEE
jgi:hypothetical protein